MNSEEVIEVKKTWEIPRANPTESGMAILIRYFTKYPSNLEKFPSFKDTPVEELGTNPRFKAHASRIIRVFDESIGSLGEDGSDVKLEEIWTKIAISHFNRQIEKQAFNELKEIILEVLTAACSLTEEQIDIWARLLDSVYVIIFTTLDKLKSGELVQQ